MNTDYSNVLKKYLGIIILILGYGLLILGGYWRLIDGNGMSKEELNLYTWVYLGLGLVINMTVFAFVKDWIIKRGKSLFVKGNDSEFIGYKYVKDADTNSKTQNIIDRFGMETEIDETIDIVNMENKIQAYANKVTKKKFKIEKKLKRYIKIRNIKNWFRSSKVDQFDIRFDKLKADKIILVNYTKEIDNIKKTLRRESITEEVIDFDEKFMQLYTIKYKYYSYESIKFQTTKVNNIIDKIKNSKMVFGFGGTVVSLSLAVMFFRYFNGKIFDFQDDIPLEYITILVMIIIASIVLVFSNIYRSLSGFRALYYNDVAEVSYIYRKFNMRYRKDIDRNKIEALPDDAQLIIDNHFKNLDI